MGSVGTYFDLVAKRAGAHEITHVLHRQFSEGLTVRENAKTLSRTTSAVEAK